MKIGIIGTGMMGGALARAIAKSVDAKDILLFDADAEKSRALASELGASVSESAASLVAKVECVLLAVKPQFMQSVCSEISGEVNYYNPLVVSIAAGLKIDSISANLNFVTKRIIRLMPNLPATVGEGMIALSYNSENVSEEDVVAAKNILSAAGKIECVSESLMDCVTGVSGSGPAYAFMFIEAMADAAVLCGMSRSQAYTYAAQTLKGAAEMVLSTGKHPAELKDAVCSPAGTTIAGVKVLEENGFRGIVMNAVKDATNRSRELGKKS